jgi:hypothetical protein
MESPPIRMIVSYPYRSDFKLVVIIDDSDSVSLHDSSTGLPNVVTLLQMEGKLWAEARDALAGVAELSRLKGGEGLDIYCLNNPKYQPDLRVSDLFSFTLKETYS